MAGYTAAQVKELRERSGAGMLDTKNALVDSDGDMDKAMELLRQKGLANAAKKSGRAAADGQVNAATSDDGQMGVMLELNCETDFVAKGDAFKELITILTEQALTEKAADLATFLAQPAMAMPSQSVRDFITEKIGTIKENITLRRFQLYNLDTDGLIQTYVHTGGKIGVITEFTCSDKAMASKPEMAAFGKDICMQIASFGADFVSMDDIPQTVIDEETRIEMGKEDLQNKPENIRENIVKGRVQKQLGAKVLLQQPYVKDSSLSVDEYVKQTGEQLGGTITVSRFTRFVLGEGVEKEEANFADEVMAQLK